MTSLPLTTYHLPLPSHGFLILDKPLGITSAKAVAEVKRLLGCKKIGHAGTLDPLASGVLPLAIGEATKAFDYVASAVKEYRFTITFGQERSTDDSEGEITFSTDTLPAEEDLLRALPEFTGTIWQKPPVFSALKIEGERAYKRARAGESVEMAARQVEIHTLHLEAVGCQVSGVSEKILKPDTRNLTPISTATFTVTCGKGTYVRALARDIARKCNSLGYVSMLRRVRVGKFHESQAILLDKLPDLMHNAALFEAWVPIELALDDIPAIELDLRQATSLRHGQAVGVNKADGRYIALQGGRIVALAECGKGLLKPLRVFNINEKEFFDVAGA